MKALIFCFIIIPCIVLSLSFDELTDIDLPGVSQSSLDWGDFDHDGYLDLLVTGYTGSMRISRVYKNNGDGTFSHQEGIELTGVNFGRGVWGDYNNNGFLDIII